MVLRWSAHSRRKFFDARKNSRKTGGARKGLSYIQKPYAIEKQLRAKNLSNKEFEHDRRERAEVVLNQFLSWLEQQQDKVVPESLLDKAVHYTLSEWPKLIHYLNAWYLTPDNNVAEQRIRPFVVGKKAWLFSETPRGAHASAALCSLVESAAINGLETYRYLRHLFSKIPKAGSEADLEKILPYKLQPEELHNRWYGLNFTLTRFLLIEKPWIG